MKYWLYLTFLLVTTGIYAQSDDVFWSKPGEIVKDASGRITYEERRDPSNYTVRVYSNGTWITQHYRPHTGQLIQIDAPDSEEEWLYDDRGNNNGLRVRINGITLTLQSEQDVRLSAGGLPPLSLDRDQRARATSIRDVKGAEVAHFNFDSRGYLRSVLAGVQTLELGTPHADGTISETLKTADGAAVYTAEVAGSVSNPHSVPFGLDIVRSQVGLGDDWEKRVTFRRSATSTVITASDASGKSVLYIVRHGGNRFGFDPSGKALHTPKVPRPARLPVSGANDGSMGRSSPGTERLALRPKRKRRGLMSKTAWNGDRATLRGS